MPVLLKIWKKMLLIFSLYFILKTVHSSPQPRTTILIFFHDYKFPYDHKKILTPILQSEDFHFSYKTLPEYTLGCHPIIPTDFLKVILTPPNLDYSRLISKYPSIIKNIILDQKIQGSLYNAKSFLPIKPPDEAKTKYQYQFSSKPYELLDIKTISEHRKTKGKNAKVAIFDTGVSETFEAAFQDKIKEIKNWTKEKYFGTDFNGHGTFIASLFINNHTECAGLAPDVDLYIFKVFTKTQESYTSWFLEAFNYALYLQVDLINFSIGSTDFTEKTFIDKIREIVTNKITIVSAAGNDGPYIGTINNPADIIEVIAVGGLDTDNETIASFSSRGMTTWELLWGNGRVKPEILTYSKYVLGADLDSGNCVMKSGTSLATGIITASLALIVSYLRMNNMERFINPASLRQAVLESAVVLGEASIFEQGAGVFDLKRTFEYFDKNTEKISLFPKEYNLSSGFYYNLPYSNQPIYKNGMPMIFNLTLINGISDSKDLMLKEWEWVDSNLPKVMLDIDIETNVNRTKGLFFYYLGIFLNIIHDFQVFPLKQDLMQISGTIRLHFAYKVENLTLDFKLSFDYIETPPREKRLLWDQFHNMKFPESNYIPRDSLTNYDYPYEWHGDHPYTNFFQLFNVIRSQGYYLEILRGSFNCFEASNYASLLIIDPEEMFSQREIEKIEYDVIKSGLSLIIFADWFDLAMIEKNTYYNTAQLETRKPIIGGSNIPSLNELLNSFGIALGSSVFAGDLQLLNKTISYFSGSYIVKFPKNGLLFTFDLFNESDLILTSQTKKKASNQHVPILGLLKRVYGIESSGKIIVYGDSNCIDSSYLYNDCFELFKDFLRFLRNEEMLIFNEFHHYQLPLDYEDEFEKPLYWGDWKNKQRFLNYSKFTKKNSKGNNHCKKVTLFREEIMNRMNEMEKTALKSVFNSNNPFDKINKWITDQKNKARFFPEFNLMLASEYIQVVIMVLSISFVVFFIVLIRKKRRKKYNYSQLPAKDPILLV